MEEFISLGAHHKWRRYFENSEENGECLSKLLKILQFFAIPSHNVNAERIFSLNQGQWTKEVNTLNVESLRGLFFLQ
jgi:hypothetical protein